MTKTDFRCPACQRVHASQRNLDAHNCPGPPDMSAPEPPIGAEVVDRLDRRWEHVEGTYGNHYWMRSDIDGGDPESWTRVNEFGPLRPA